MLQTDHLISWEGKWVAGWGGGGMGRGGGVGEEWQKL